jgi:nucleotide sugar dehydrogenase
VKLTENVFRDVNIALMSELAVLYERLGIDIYEVIEAASSKSTFLPHYPGAGVGGPCLPANAYYLIVEGNDVGYVPYLVRMAREINDRMPLEVVRHTMDALNKAKKSVKTARIAILGITYKPGVKDTRNSPARIIVRALRERGARLAICDPLVADTEFEGQRVTAVVEEAVREADCVVLVTAHDSFKRLDLTRIAKLAAKPFVLVDGRGAFRLARKPNGTLYAGIGIPFRLQD